AAPTFSLRRHFKREREEERSRRRGGEKVEEEGRQEHRVDEARARGAEDVDAAAVDNTAKLKLPWTPTPPTATTRSRGRATSTRRRPRRANDDVSDGHEDEDAFAEHRDPDPNRKPTLPRLATAASRFTASA
ncbi:unnamed protein product, partial [Urochloa humidicola]